MKQTIISRLPIATLAIVSFVSLTIDARGAAILSPTGALTDMGEVFAASRTRNQSGLSAGFTSNVTDFETYIAANRTATHGNGLNLWGSTLGIRSGNFDFALGGTYLVTAMAFWNLIGDPSAVREFTLLLDDNPSFSSPDVIGTFTASNTLGTGSNTAAQVFTIPATAASFVRLQILNTWSVDSSHTAFNEAAFRVAPVPEPSSAMLLLFGALSFLRRRSHRTPEPSA